VRDLLHTGDVVRADLPDPSLQLDGVVATDGSDALFRLSLLDMGMAWPPPRVPVPGLDPDRVYAVSLQPPGDGPALAGRGRVAWLDGVRLSGRALASIGLQAPLLKVDESILVRFRAVD
jgi:alpha-galactosidase